MPVLSSVPKVRRQRDSLICGPGRVEGMNIFANSSSPERSARALDDRRVLKMAVESAQLLSTAMHQRGLVAPYRPTHTAHPAVKWTGTCQGNFRWVLRHFDALTSEYTRRFGRRHACARWSRTFWEALDQIPPGRRQTFVNLSGHPRVVPATEAYRRGLRDKWRLSKYPPRWTRARPPRWTRATRHVLRAVNSSSVSSRSQGSAGAPERSSSDTQGRSGTARPPSSGGRTRPRTSGK